MKRTLLLGLTLISLGASAPLSGQETNRIDARLQDRPVIELVRLIEQQTPFRVLGDAGLMDSVRVSVDVQGMEAESLLRTALQAAHIAVSRYANDLILTAGEGLSTELSEGFFLPQQTAIPTDSLSYLALRGNVRASSENKVYTVGNAGQSADEWVTIEGTVSHFKTGEPLRGVSLQSADGTAATVSDASGHYVLRLPAGRHDLQIRSVGLKETKRQVMLYASGQFDIELEEEVYALEEVSVSANRMANVRSTTIGVNRLQVKEIKNIPTAFGEVDILKVVMALPGVKAVGEVSSGFNVRGGATDQNLILYNNGTVYNPNHLFGLFSIFNADVVEGM